MFDEEGIWIPIIGIISTIALPIILGSYVLIYLFRSRSKERMEMLKQGIVPSAQIKASPNKYVALRNGCLFIGLSLGLIVGLVIDALVVYSDVGSFFIMLSSSVLFLGLGYIAFYILVKEKEIDE